MDLILCIAQSDPEFGISFILQMKKLRIRYFK